MKTTKDHQDHPTDFRYTCAECTGPMPVDTYLVVTEHEDDLYGWRICSDECKKKFLLKKKLEKI